MGYNRSNRANHTMFTSSLYINLVIKKLDLCEHEKDFGMKASLSFFATSHGKSPCDGIGGTVKRSTAMESLRRPLENQILNINDIVAYCSKTLTSITFQILPKWEPKSLQVKLKELLGLVSLFTCSLAIVAFFTVARLVDKPIQQGRKKPQSAALLSKKKTNHGNATILSQWKWTCQQTKCDFKTTNNNGSDKRVAFLVFIDCFINKIGLFSDKTVLSNFYMKYSISH